MVGSPVSVYYLPDNPRVSVLQPGPSWDPVFTFSSVACCLRTRTRADPDIVDGSRPAPLGEPARSRQSLTAYPVQVELAIMDAQDKYVWVSPIRPCEEF